jgi:hypothetical protein
MYFAARGGYPSTALMHTLAVPTVCALLKDHPDACKAALRLVYEKASTEWLKRDRRFEESLYKD